MLPHSLLQLPQYRNLTTYKGTAQLWYAELPQLRVKSSNVRWLPSIPPSSKPGEHQTRRLTDRRQYPHSIET
jgi:hypothetical protein